MSIVGLRLRWRGRVRPPDVDQLEHRLLLPCHSSCSMRQGRVPETDLSHPCMVPRRPHATSKKMQIAIDIVCQTYRHASCERKETR